MSFQDSLGRSFYTNIVLKCEGGFVDHPVRAENGEMPSTLDLLVHG